MTLSMLEIYFQAMRISETELPGSKEKPSRLTQWILTLKCTNLSSSYTFHLSGFYQTLSERVLKPRFS